MELKRSLDEEARGSMLLASLERVQLGNPTLAKTLAAELDMAKGNHLEEQVRVAALGLWEKVVAQEKLLQLCGDDLKEDICLLRALAKVVPADAETECQNVVAMLQPLILLGQPANPLNALGGHAQGDSRACPRCGAPHENRARPPALLCHDKQEIR